MVAAENAKRWYLVVHIDNYAGKQPELQEPRPAGPFYDVYPNRTRYPERLEAVILR